MDKKVLIISTSLRRESNSELLAQQFARGAKDAGWIRKVCVRSH